MDDDDREALRKIAQGAVLYAIGSLAVLTSALVLGFAWRLLHFAAGG